MPTNDGCTTADTVDFLELSSKNDILSACYLLRHIPKEHKLALLRDPLHLPADGETSQEPRKLPYDLLLRFRVWNDFFIQQPMIAPLAVKNSQRAVSNTSFFQKPHKLTNKYLFAPQSAFGLPYLANQIHIEDRDPLALLFIIWDCLNGAISSQSIVDPIASILSRLDRFTPSNSLSDKPLYSEISSIPWKAFTTNIFLKLIIHGDPHIKPVPHPFLAGWTELQSLCLGHVPALIQIVFGKEFKSLYQSILHDALDNCYMEANINRHRVLKTLVMMYLAAKFLPTFATDPPEVLAWKYGFNWFSIAKQVGNMNEESVVAEWRPGDPVPSSWLDYVQIRPKINGKQVWVGGSEEMLRRGLTAPGLLKQGLTTPWDPCYRDSLAHGLMAVVETLRVYLLSAAAGQSTPPWVACSLHNMGIEGF